MTHADTPCWSRVNAEGLYVCICVSDQWRIIPQRIAHVEGRHYWTYLDLFGKGIRGTYVKRVAKEKRQWNLSVRSDLLGGMMNLEVLLWSVREGDDSSFLFFSCSSVFVKSRADDIHQREDSRSWVSKVEHKKLEQRTRGGKNRTCVESEQSDDFLHLLLQYYCLIAESSAEGVSLPQALSEAQRICGFFWRADQWTFRQLLSKLIKKNCHAAVPLFVPPPPPLFLKSLTTHQVSVKLSSEFRGKLLNVTKNENQVGFHQLWIKGINCLPECREELHILLFRQYFSCVRLTYSVKSHARQSGDNWWVLKFELEENDYKERER